MSLVNFKAQNHPQQTRFRKALDEVDDRATTPEVFAEFNARFGFTLDVAAAAHNAKCPRYFSKADDGLAQPWNGRVWCNPPYSSIEPWIVKAWEEWRAGRSELIVFLLPANRTEQGFGSGKSNQLAAPARSRWSSCPAACAFCGLERWRLVQTSGRRSACVSSSGVAASDPERQTGWRMPLETIPTVSAVANWFGSARMVADRIGPELGKRSLVVVPFAGGMSELPYIDAAKVVVNDRHRHVINLARVIAEPELMPQLLARLESAVFHPDTLSNAQKICRLVEDSHKEPSPLFGGGTPTTVWSRLMSLTLAGGRDRAMDELARFGATAAVISTNLRLRLDGLPAGGQAEPTDPGVAVYFQIGGKPRVIACDRWDRVADNLAAIAKTIEAQRAMLRNGAVTADQIFEGFKALPPVGAASEVVATIDDAARFIARVASPGGDSGDYVVQSVLSQSDTYRTLYRAAAKKLHPDSAGKDTPEWNTLQVAAALLDRHHGS